MFGREEGSKAGSGGVASASAAGVDRRERLRKLALETIDISRECVPPRRSHQWRPRRALRLRARLTGAAAAPALRSPYYMRNHVGQAECRLCLTLHPNEGNYLAHTQGALRAGGGALLSPARAHRAARSRPATPGEPGEARGAGRGGRARGGGEAGEAAAPQGAPSTSLLALSLSLSSVLPHPYPLPFRRQ